MSPKFYKHKLLFDEGLFSRKRLKRLNSPGIKDEKVYELAVKQKRIIVTYNVRDFKKLAKQNKNVGVIGISQGFTPEKLDLKLNALLSKSSEKSFYGKYTPLK